MERLLVTILVGLIFINTLSNCNEPKNHLHQPLVYDTNDDTIIRTVYEDTSIYHLKATDSSIKLSDFNFNVLQCKIYFDPQKVIPFCDSTIEAAKSDKTRWESQNSSIISSMTELKDFALLKKTELESVDWITTLLNRFNPLIIDTVTKEKTKWMLVEKFRSKTQGHTSYFTLTNKGDTLLVGFVQDFLDIAPN